MMSKNDCSTMLTVITAGFSKIGELSMVDCFNFTGSKKGCSIIAKATVTIGGNTGG